MRTTIDLPESLLRRAKATAALRGMKLKDFIAITLEQGMQPTTERTASKFGQGRPIPVVIPPTGHSIPNLSNAELEEIFLREDLERLGFDRPA